MSRTKRKPYSGAKAVDVTCRSHGSCPHCENGRKHKKERQAPLILSSEESIIAEGDDHLVIEKRPSSSEWL